MKTFVSILVLFLAVAAVNCDLCRRTSPVPCRRPEVWQENVLCRIRGIDFHNGTFAEDGYWTDALANSATMNLGVNNFHCEKVT